MNPKMNPVAKNLNKFNKPATHKDKKQAMKRGEQKHKGKAMPMEAQRDSGSDLAKIGRILMDKAVTQKDENLSNVMARVGNELTMFGTNTGARTPEALEDRAGVPMEIIDQLVDYAKKFSDDPAVKTQDVEDMIDDNEDEFDSDDDDKIIDVGDADDDEETKEALGDNKKYGIAVIQMLEAIVRDQSAKEVRFQDGKGKVDMFTASAITKVFDALNDDNQRRVLDMIGNKAGFMKMAKFALGKVGESIEEGNDDDYDRSDDGPYAEIEMAMGQLEFIKYACDELEEHFRSFPMKEWFQNKLARVHGTMMSLHAYIEGKEGKYGLNDDINEGDWEANFKKRIGYTVKGGAAADMMKKQAAQAQADNPDAGKGLGPGVLDIAKARKKAKEKGVKAPGNLRSSPNTRDPKRLPEAKKMKAKDDPCWKGYKMVGMKKKGNKEVPNCVPGKKGD